MPVTKALSAHMDNPVELTEIKLEVDTEYGPLIRLIDFDHTDYIEDVLCEVFGVEYEYKVVDDEKGIYILYFGLAASMINVGSVIKDINNKHATTAKLYDTI
jgi:hypothetical protein